MASLRTIILLLLICLRGQAQPLTQAELAWPIRSTTTNAPVRTFWLMADAGVYSDSSGSVPASEGGSVLRWNDQSDTHYDVTNSGSFAPVFHTNQLNGLPTLRFANSGLWNASGSVLQPMCWIMVVRFDTGSTPFANTVVLGNINNSIYGAGFGRTSDTGDVAIFTANLNSSPKLTGGTISTNGFNLITYVANGSSSFIRVNGVEVSSGSVENKGMNQLFLGGDARSFDLAEIIRIQNAAPTLADIQDAESYLTTKWGL